MPRAEVLLLQPKKPPKGEMTIPRGPPKPQAPSAPCGRKRARDVRTVGKTPKRAWSAQRSQGPEAQLYRLLRRPGRL